LANLNQLQGLPAAKASTRDKNGHAQDASHHAIEFIRWRAGWPTGGPSGMRVGRAREPLAVFEKPEEPNLVAVMPCLCHKPRGIEVSSRQYVARAATH